MGIKMGKLFDKLFVWTPIAVEKPVEVKDKNGMVKGYRVVVTYVHQGAHDNFFGNDCQAWYHLYGSPLEAARSFYNKYNAQAKEWQKRSVQHVKVK